MICQVFFFKSVISDLNFLYHKIVALLKKEKLKLITFSVYVHEYTLRDGDDCFSLMHTYRQVKKRHRRGGG